MIQEADETITGDPLLHLKASLLQQDGAVDMSSKIIDSHLTEEKLSLLNASQLESDAFRSFLRCAFDDSKLRGQFLLGYRCSDIDVILSLFHRLAQTKTFNKMFFYARSLVCKLINK